VNRTNPVSTARRIMDQDLDEDLLANEECDSDLVIVKDQNAMADEASANAGKARICSMGLLALLHI
jgi:hypothetical protein